MSTVLRKDQLEASLHEEKKLIENGVLKEDNPLDKSDLFRRLCDACRRADLKACQEAITEGANINARDEFDYTPLILASLCGHYEIVHLLLESGGLCERDTFQGERCLYNALNDQIRNLLLEYDYSKSTDPLQPFAAYITTLFSRDSALTSDIVVRSAEKSFNLHKFLLAARSPYFRKKLDNAPETSQWNLPASYPPQSFEIALRYVYMGELGYDVTLGQTTGFTEEQILEGIDKIGRQLEIEGLWTAILNVNNRRLARQQRTDETERGCAQLQKWFEENVVAYKISTDVAKIDKVQWDRNNATFADILICAEEPVNEEPLSVDSSVYYTPTNETNGAIPIGAFSSSQPSVPQQTTSKAVLFPVHRAILMRSEYFRGMFNSSFTEAQESPHLKVVRLEYSPAVVQALLAFLYAERTDFGIDVALDVLFAADELLIDRLKAKTAQLISTLGNGVLPRGPALAEEDGDDTDLLDPFQVLEAAYDLRVPRLETFAARFFAYRLERYIDTPLFRDAVAKSASRISKREVTDSIELVDDIRWYLSERFRMRFESVWEGADEEPDEAEAEVDEHLANLAQRVASGTPGAWPSPMLDTPQARTQTERGEPRPTTPPADSELRTLDGNAVDDEFSRDAVNYQMLLDKIDNLLDGLELDG